MSKLRGIGLMAALTLALAGCDDGPTGPTGPQAPISLSVMVLGGQPAPALQLFGAGELALSAGGHDLVIQSAEVVLREIEFERAEETTGCGADEGEVEGSDDDGCEEFEAGPMALPLPLDGSVSEQLEVNVPAGTYDELEYDIHKLGDDPADVAFLSQPGNEIWDGASVRVTGTWDGQPFTYTADIDVEVEMEFPTPIVVEAGQSYNVTLVVDVGAWFFDGVELIDPNTALKGQANEQLVEDRIEAAFEVFEDDDHDGVPHHEDDDEGL